MTINDDLQKSFTPFVIFSLPKILSNFYLKKDVIKSSIVQIYTKDIFSLLPLFLNRGKKGNFENNGKFA